MRKGNYRLNQGGSADLDPHLLSTSAPPHLLSISVPPHLLSASASSQHLRTFSAHPDLLSTSAPPHLLSISGPSQRLRTFSAPPDLFSTSATSQHFFSVWFWKRAEKVRRCWGGGEGFQICTFSIVLKASLKTRFILFVAGSFDKWRVLKHAFKF
jgi:hypothetical protein